MAGEVGTIETGELPGGIPYHLWAIRDGLSDVRAMLTLPAVTIAGYNVVTGYHNGTYLRDELVFERRRYLCRSPLWSSWGVVRSYQYGPGHKLFGGGPVRCNAISDLRLSVGYVQAELAGLRSAMNKRVQRQRSQGQRYWQTAKLIEDLE